MSTSASDQFFASAEAGFCRFFRMRGEQPPALVSLLDTASILGYQYGGFRNALSQRTLGLPAVRQGGKGRPKFAASAVISHLANLYREAVAASAMDRPSPAVPNTVPNTIEVEEVAGTGVHSSILMPGQGRRGRPSRKEEAEAQRRGISVSQLRRDVASLEVLHD